MQMAFVDHAATEYLKPSAFWSVKTCRRRHNPAHAETTVPVQPVPQQVFKEPQQRKLKRMQRNAIQCLLQTLPALDRKPTTSASNSSTDNTTTSPSRIAPAQEAAMNQAVMNLQAAIRHTKTHTHTRTIPIGSEHDSKSSGETRVTSDM